MLYPSSFAACRSGNNQAVRTERQRLRLPPLLLAGIALFSSPFPALAADNCAEGTGQACEADMLRLDGSSDETLSASRERIAAHLSPEARQELDTAFITLYLAELSAHPDLSAAEIDVLYRAKLDGKSVAEVVKMAAATQNTEATQKALSGK